MSATQSTAVHDPAPFDVNVGFVVRALMASRGLDAKHLAPLVGMKPSTLYNRLAGKAWYGWELDAIAAFFSVSPSVFFAPVDEVFTQNRKKKMAPDLRIVRGGGETGPRRRSLSVV